MEVSGQLHAPGRFTSGIHWIEGWVGPRANACPCQESNPSRLAHTLVSVLTNLQGAEFYLAKCYWTTFIHDNADSFDLNIMRSLYSLRALNPE
jgi:hypothetical protein